MSQKIAEPSDWSKMGHVRFMFLQSFSQSDANIQKFQGICNSVLTEVTDKIFSPEV